MSLKTKCFVTIILSICVLVGLSFGLFYADESCNKKIVYPLSNIKNDGAVWALSITEVGKKGILLMVSDQQTLYNNRRNFKIELMKEVYWSTPGYFVKVFRDKKEIQSYPLLYIEQIEFGTIPRPGTQG